MKKIVLTFGLLAGGVMSLMMLVTIPFHDQIGNDRAMVVGYTTMVLSFLLIFFGVRAYRDSVSGGRISFGRALAVGLLIGVVASICYDATWQVVSRKYYPDYLEKYQAMELEKARAAGKSDAELLAQKAQQEKDAKLYNNPLVNIAFVFLEPMPVALVVSLITAGILSRRKLGSPQIP